MAKSIIVFGAGASAHAGAPLTSNFLDKARRLANNSNNQRFKNSFAVVNEAISDLQLVFAKSFLDLNNIETLFGAVEMARYIDRLGSKTGRSIEVIRDEFINLISYTLEYSTQYGGNTSDGRPLPSAAYASLVENIKESPDEFQLITFNYDLGLDYALAYYGVDFDYGFKPNAVSGTKLLKLHGSINWGLCECGSLDFFPLSVDELANYKSTVWDRIPVEILMDKLKSSHAYTCNKVMKTAIIPPTWTKSEYYLPVKSIWKQAAEAISRAENIYIAGYSLPTTDAFFPYLYSLSTLDSSTRISRFWVYNLDGTEPIQKRYKALVGKGIENSYQFHATDFSQVPNHIFRSYY